jgi:hypothetical protein
MTNEENFCRVFALPEEYPSGFCFGGGRPVTMMMVDWFQPLDPENLEEPWEVVRANLLKFLAQKQYIQKGREYLVLTDFHESLVFTG